MNKLATMSVNAHYMDRNWALGEVQLAYSAVDHLIFSDFERQLTMIGEWSTY